MIHEACVAGSLIGEMEKRCKNTCFCPISLTASLLMPFKDFAWNQVTNCKWNAKAHWGSRLPPWVLRVINNIVGAKTFLPFSLRVYWFEPLNPQVSLTLLSPLDSLSRAVTKISSCRVNTTSRREIKQVGVSFLFFLYFSMKVAGATFIVAARNPQPLPWALLGYSNKIEWWKNSKCTVHGGRRKEAFLFPSFSSCFLFSSSQPPTTQRPLAIVPCGEESFPWNVH